MPLPNNDTKTQGLDLSSLDKDPDFAAARNYSAKETAEHFNTQRRRLLRHFRAQCDATPSERLAEHRDFRAVNLLRGSKLSIKEIAHLLKYSQPAAFGRAFKRRHGVWPREFRRQWQEQEVARRGEGPR